VTSETYQRICTLLGEALDMLDANHQQAAAIYVSHALDALGHVFTDPDDPRAATAAP